MKQWNSTLSVPKKTMRRSAFKPPSLPLKKEGNNKPTSAPKRKKIKPSTLKRKLDEIFSEYVRRRAVDDNGYVTCYCGAKIPWRESDNSHYIPRGHLATRFSERNCHPSCRRCNRFMGGNLQAYSLFLERKYGNGILQELEKEKQKITKNFPYEEMIQKYSLLLKQV